MPSPAFSRALQQKTVDVPYLALLLARAIAYPQLDVNNHLARLERLVASAAPHVVGAAEPAQALATYLFDTEAFRGNAAAYADPRNSFLNEVLARRLGIPITLSVLYVAVARSLGIDAYGVGLPGHFIVGVNAGADALLLDPFHQGQRLTLADCHRLVRETTGYEGDLDPAWLRPATSRDTLARLLNNLRLIYVQQQAWSQARLVVEHLQIIQPDVPDHLRDMGLIYYEQGALYQAARYLERYLALAPDTPDAGAIRANLRPAFARWARRN